MELTPDLLLEAKFGPARRGYDMAEVDDFLERCAEGLDVLLSRLKAEFDRAERAEARVAELEAAGASDPTLVDPGRTAVDDESEPAPAGVEEPAAVDEPMRILVHAERTAEAAVADARAEAERIRNEAESIASQQRSEAETMLATAKAEAEEEALRAGEETKRAIEAEVMTLRHDRDALADDIRNLRRWLDEQRTRMRSTARELERLVEDPAALQDLAAPEVAGSSAPESDETATDAADDHADGDGDREAERDAEHGGGPWDAGDLGFGGGEATQAVPPVDADEDPDDPWGGPDR